MTTDTLSWEEKRDWLRLIRTPRIGPVSFRDLMKRYGNAAEVIRALPNLTRSSGYKLPSLESIEAELDANERMGIRLIASCEADYPAMLKAVDPCPPVLSIWGDINCLHKPCIAIVGSRNASAIGQRFARQIANELGESGLTIVSGLARGIDAAAHSGSLRTGTAAVLGGGVDHVYPRQNAEIYDAIKQSGALISESPLSYRATAKDFPRRNRIISGLSLGVIVIEAAERSGTLITARYALEQNREVMAAPGSPLDPRTKGCNRLIRQGAALIETSQDILDIINQMPTPINTVTPFEDPEKAFDWAGSQSDIETLKTQMRTLLSPTPTSRDEIIRASKQAPSLVNATLLEMELLGEITVEPDGKVSTSL